MRHALQQCCVQLKSKIARKQAVQEQRDRKRTLSKHIPNAAFAVMQVLKVRSSFAAFAVQCCVMRCATMLLRMLSGVSVRGSQPERFQVTSAANFAFR